VPVARPRARGTAPNELGAPRTRSAHFALCTVCTAVAVAGVLPIGPRGPQAGPSALSPQPSGVVCVKAKGLSLSPEKNRVPGAPPVLGSLARSADRAA
jgi:hypothetical protein